jgi:hypothetical protein
MKSLYLILISLLFVLVASKTEKNGNSLFSKAKTIFSEEGEEDKDLCHAGSDAKTCKAITKDLWPSTQCCYMKAEIIGFDEMSVNMCEQMIKPFAPFSDLIKSPKFFPFAREMLGFAMYGPPNQLHEFEEYIGVKGKLDIDCADSHLSVNGGIDEYTDQDKDILADSNHCLNDLYQKYENISENYPYFPPLTTQSLKCSEKKLLQTSIDAGLECGSLTFTLNIKNVPMPIYFSSCMVFEYDLFSNIKIPKEFVSFMESMLEMVDGTFVVEITDSKGNSFTFDSETGNYDKSSFTSISKYLLILIGLFLF